MDDVAALLRLSMLLFCDENGLTLPNACSFIHSHHRKVASDEVDVSAVPRR